MVTFLLLVIGGLNWGVYALFSKEVGSLLGGMDSIVAKLVYILVGLSAIVELVGHKKCCSLCGMKKGGGQMQGNPNQQGGHQG